MSRKALEGMAMVKTTFEYPVLSYPVHLCHIRPPISIQSLLSSPVSSMLSFLYTMVQPLLF